MILPNEERNPGEPLFRECELGTDMEEIEYVRENHMLQIRVGAESFYLFQRAVSGSMVTGAASSWDTSLPQFSTYVWKPTDGQIAHPDTRIQNSTAVQVFNNGIAMTRAFDKSSIAYNTEYAVAVDVGTDKNSAGAIKLWFNEGFTPGRITWKYKNLCSCVDRSTGYPNRECPLCRGTSYPAAFTQWLGAGTKYNPNNTILVRVPMAPETSPATQIGRVQQRQYRHWMQYTPYVNNYDLIIGTMGTNKGLIFEITQKSDSSWRGILMHQEFNTLQIESSDIRYKMVVQTLYPASPIPAETTSTTENFLSDAEVV